MSNREKSSSSNNAINTKMMAEKLTKIMDDFNENKERKKKSNKYYINELKIKLVGSPAINDSGDLLIIPPDPEKLDLIDSGNLTIIEFPIRAMPVAKKIRTTKEVNKDAMQKLAQLIKSKKVDKISKSPK